MRAQLEADPLSAFVGEVEESLARLRERIADGPYRAGSRALAFAMAAGLPPRMTYNVADTAKYMGVDAQTLYDEHKAGRIRFVIPKGQTKGYRIKVEEVERWLDEN